MILKQAKQNGIDIIIAIAIILGLLVPSMFLSGIRGYIIPPENGMPLFNTIYEHLFDGGINGWTQVASLLLIFVEISLLVLLNSDFELTRAKPTMFALVFLLSTLTYIPCNTLLPEQVANIFITLGLIKIFACHSMDNATHTFFDAGLFFGIGFLFCAPAAVMLAVGLIAILVFRPIKGNELAIHILGFMTPVLFYIAIYYLIEGTLEPIKDFVETKISDTRLHTITYNSVICLAADAVQLIIASALIYNDYAKYNLFHSRAYRLLLIMFVMICCSYFVPMFSLQAMRMTALPITILFVTVFYNSRPSLMLDIFFAVFVLGNMALQLLWYRL
jgi:hypothetical protein